MSDDYKPTINDLWPDPEDMPEEVKRLIHEIAEMNAHQLRQIQADPYHRSKPWWRVTRTEHGVVGQVQVNKLSGPAAGLWIFRLTIDDQGRAVIEADRHTWVSDGETFPLQDEPWQIPARLTSDQLALVLSELVGQRTAKGVVQRFRQAS